MTVEEARMIWLTMIGSDWVCFTRLHLAEFYMANKAYKVLSHSGDMERDFHRYNVKIKCKS
jgi:hypothetical protein